MRGGDDVFGEAVDELFFDLDFIVISAGEV